MAYSTNRGYPPLVKIQPIAYLTSNETEAHTQKGKCNNREKWARNRFADEKNYRNTRSTGVKWKMEKQK